MQKNALLDTFEFYHHSSLPAECFFLKEERFSLSSTICTLFHTLDRATRCYADVFVESKDLSPAIYSFELTWFSQILPPDATTGNVAFP